MLHGWIREQARWSECCVLIGYPNRQYEPSLPIWDIRLSPKKKSFLFGQTIKPLFTKFKLVRSRCLDTGQIILAFHLPRLRLGLWKRKERTWPLSSHLDGTSLSITHICFERTTCAQNTYCGHSSCSRYAMGPLFPRGRGSHTWKFSPFVELM